MPTRTPLRAFSVLTAGLTAALFFGGCHGNRDADDEAPPPRVPAMQVVLLQTRPAGDNGQPLVRQSSGDDTSGAAPAPGAETATQGTPLDQLSTQASSPGLVVCAPVAGGAAAQFGTGAARWLDFTVAGLPQMGQTPLWAGRDRAQTEMKRSNLALTPADAAKLAGIVGVPTVAVGTLTGSPVNLTLSYQLLHFPGGKAVGAPLTLTGTQAQITAQLPALARQMAARLAVPTSALPGAVGLSPAELSFLGSLPLYTDNGLPAAQSKPLLALATKAPLARFFAMNTVGDSIDDRWRAEAKLLQGQQPVNALVWAQIGRSGPSLLATNFAPLAHLRRTYPKNALFAAATTWTQRSRQQMGAERRAGEQAVQNAPRSPDAWLSLGWTISQQASHLRYARVAGAISNREWAILKPLYQDWYFAEAQAARLDPLYGTAWNRLAEAAAFAGRPRAADQAFWKNVELDPNNPAIYGWGLQMYQQKWDDNPQQLNRLVQTLITLPYPTVAQGLYAAQMLKDNEPEPNAYKSDIQTLVTALLARTQQAIAKNPGDAQAHYDQAVALGLLGRPSKAVTEYQNVVLLRPKDAAAYEDLGNAYDVLSQPASAVSAYRQATRLAPGSARVLCSLGKNLKQMAQFSQAQAVLRRAIKIAPRYAEAHYTLGMALFAQGQQAKGLLEMQEAVQLNPASPYAQTELCLMLDMQGQYHQALAAGEQALTMTSGNYMVMDDMADAYLHLKQWDNSLEMSRMALEVNAGDPVAHQNLGEAYIGQGKRAEAREEWNKVLTLGDERMAKSARAMLAKYPEN